MRDRVSGELALSDGQMWLQEAAKQCGFSFPDGLNPGDVCHIGIVGNHVSDEAVYIGPIEGNPPFKKGLRFSIGNDEIDLLWGDLVECRKL